MCPKSSGIYLRDFEPALSGAVILPREGTGRCVAAKLGVVTRVIITDGGDFINFEWKFGEGVTYTPEMRGRQ
ncbi:hypothetical protein [Bradyrhizobium sp. CB1015]|nr:hypothetical protein [Bradyrhizobium sp. CB1015]UWU93573.1 hypothetical protein N2604_06470 [Bradyrhizobium sp. CB1015]